MTFGIRWVVKVNQIVGTPVANRHQYGDAAGCGALQIPGQNADRTPGR